MIRITKCVKPGANTRVLSLLSEILFKQVGGFHHPLLPPPPFPLVHLSFALTGKLGFFYIKNYKTIITTKTIRPYFPEETNKDKNSPVTAHKYSPNWNIHFILLLYFNMWNSYLNSSYSRQAAAPFFSL